MPDQALDARLAGLESALPALRPELHRYCARMTGSVIDGEDVLQEALLNASRALVGGAVVEDLRAWLFRIAHNTAMNHFRSRKNEMALKEHLDRDEPTVDEMPEHGDVAASLRPFLDLTPKQRSTVILRDVLGYSAAEVADLTESSVQSVKSALHRGRMMLKDRSADDEDEPALSAAEREQLAIYARCFNAHDFDRLRDMLSAEVRLELVSVEDRKGRAGVGNYYSNYEKRSDWLMAPGRVEGRPAILAFDRNDPAGPPTYFVLLTFGDGKVLSIRDFRYARYAMTDARWDRL
ncbi:MAG: sigma-70 family RNA polymerase sigma factor [Hyphomicrobiales bacterium]|nr:sigma-70 family RNA polymerase sigma factor [Hyphomicrobiales bacterium]